MTPPAFVTLTGLDAHCDAGRVAALSARYPVEWGVLFSPKADDAGRYPERATADRLLSLPVRKAAHVCGGYARTLVATGDCPDLAGLLAGRVGRVQVNTREARVDLDALAAFVGRVATGRRAILQSRDPDAFPAADAVDWLCDRSEGTGKAPGAWPVHRDTRMVGYAGGLGPDTVGGALAAIAAVHPAGVPYWIDMETRIRTDDRLDLDLCEAVLKTVYPSP